MRIYVEDGQVRPVSMVIETPRGPNTIGILTNMIEFPIAASVDADEVDNPSVECVEAVCNRAYDAAYLPLRVRRRRVQVLLETQGEPMSARIELYKARWTTSKSSSSRRRMASIFPFSAD